MISIGTIGLIKGIDSYDVSKNIKVTTYAARCIENEILMFFRSNKKYGNDVSLNDYIGVDKDGNAISLIDVMPDTDVDLTSKVSTNIDIESLIGYLSVLKENERNIIIRRYGLFNEKEATQKEIAKDMGISRSYVSRIEKRALFKLLREFNRVK